MKGRETLMDKLNELLSDLGISKVRLAKYLGVSCWLVGQMVRKNEIPHFRVGGRILFRKKSIDDYMEQQEKIAFDKLYASKK